MSHVELPTIGKSTLLGFEFQFLGFAYVAQPSPGLSGKTVQWTFFSRLGGPEPLFLLCLSEHSGTVSSTTKRAVCDKLGSVQPSAEVIPYVARGVGAATFQEFQQLMRKALPFKITWLRAKQVIVRGPKPETGAVDNAVIGKDDQHRQQ